MENENHHQDAPQAPTAEFIKTPDFVDRYVNVTQMSFSPFDLRIDMGTFEQTGTKTVISTHTLVRMSPQHAKAMASALIQNIQEFERRFGPIQVGERSMIQPAAAVPPGLRQ